jgi:Na+/H+ antiporter NhaD/arsenite permease-like protein
VVDAFARGPIAGSLATGFYGVAAVNLINNIPATILFEKMWLGSSSAASAPTGLGARLAELHPAYPDIFVDCALYASNFGANLTLIGALAGLMWFRLIRRSAGEDGSTRGPTVGEFTLYGLLIVPVVTLVTCAVIGWLRMQLE